MGKNCQILHRSWLFMYRTLDERTKILSVKIKKLCFFFHSAELWCHFMDHVHRWKIITLRNDNTHHIVG